MMKRKKVLLVMPHMLGGGAERVAAQLMNKFNERGYDTRFVLTRARRQEVVRTDLNEKTEVILLSEQLSPETAAQKLAHFPERVFSSSLGKLYEKQHRYIPASVGRATIAWQYHREIRWLRNYFLKNPDMTVIVFLQPAIPVVLLAAQNLPNKIIVSERGNPHNIMKKRYGRAFIEKYYPTASSVVFQTSFAREVYPDAVTQKGVVIKNPLKAGLPGPYHGERQKYVSTFCRLHPDKDLMTLIKAFHLFSERFPAYKLRIVGDAVTPVEKKVEAELHAYIRENGLGDKVVFMPFTSAVHEIVLRDTMYLNTSVTEGLCNAMLEAMAIGLPVVCTDCPIGGARDTIKNGENGLLVPVRDPEAFCEAMTEIAADSEKQRLFSVNASKLRESLALDRIVDQWEKIIM